MARKILDIQVTKKVITDAMKGNAKHCAIANAIQDSNPNIAWARVTSTYIDVAYHAPETVDRYRSSGKVQDFIKEFDDPHTADPKPFRLVVMEDDWIGTRPRRMNAARTETVRKIRKDYAAQTGQRMADVRIEDVPADITERGFAEAGKPVVRSKQRSDRKDRIKYNQRRSASSNFEIEDARRQMELPA